MYANLGVVVDVYVSMNLASESLLLEVCELIPELFSII